MKKLMTVNNNNVVVVDIFVQGSANTGTGDDKFEYAYRVLETMEGYAVQDPEEMNAIVAVELETAFENKNTASMIASIRDFHATVRNNIIACHAELRRREDKIMDQESRSREKAVPSGMVFAGEGEVVDFHNNDISASLETYNDEVDGTDSVTDEIQQIRRSHNGIKFVPGLGDVYISEVWEDENKAVVVNISNLEYVVDMDQLHADQDTYEATREVFHLPVAYPGAYTFADGVGEAVIVRNEVKEVLVGQHGNMFIEDASVVVIRNKKGLTYEVNMDVLYADEADLEAKREKDAEEEREQEEREMVEQAAKEKNGEVVDYARRNNAPKKEINQAVVKSVRTQQLLQKMGASSDASSQPSGNVRRETEAAFLPAQEDIEKKERAATMDRTGKLKSRLGSRKKDVPAIKQEMKETQEKVEEAGLFMRPTDKMIAQSKPKWYDQHRANGVMTVRELRETGFVNEALGIQAIDIKAPKKESKVIARVSVSTGLKTLMMNITLASNTKRPEVVASPQMKAFRKENGSFGVAHIDTFNAGEVTELDEAIVAQIMIIGEAVARKKAKK